MYGLPGTTFSHIPDKHRGDSHYAGYQQGSINMQARQPKITRSGKLIGILPIAACLWGFCGSARAQAPSPPPAANSYIGSEQCGLCHTDLYKNFYKNPHYKSIASG